MNCEPRPSSDSSQIRPPIAVDEAPDEEEPEPGSLAAGRPLGAEELGEDALLVRLGDPDAVVGHRDLGSPGAPARADGDRPALGRVPDGVVQQVGEHLPQFLPIGPDGEVGRLDLDGEPMAPVPTPLRRRDRLPDGSADVGGLERDVQRPGLQPGDAQQVVDDADEALRLAGDVAEEGLALGAR